MNTEQLLNLKKLLDEGAITQEEFDQQKQLLMPTKKSKSNIGLIIGIIAVIIVCISIISGNNDNETTTDAQTPAQTEVTNTPHIPKEFDSNFPITVSGTMYDNIIGVPEISINIKNQTDKNISAIQLYLDPKNVYGETVSNILTTNKLYTDNTIGAGESCEKAWQLLDSEIKSGNVYVYSVYFEDGTEWGNKDASVSDIKKYGYCLQVKY